MGKEKCQVDGCDGLTYARGFCEMHYRRVRKTGQPGQAGTVRERGVCRIRECDRLVDAKELCLATTNDC